MMSDIRHTNDEIAFRKPPVPHCDQGQRGICSIAANVNQASDLLMRKFYGRNLKSILSQVSFSIPME